MKKVSVIIPAYNVEKYIDQCMESVIGQTYTNLEIILINDGSTDNTDERCLYWKSRDSRIRYVSKENEGMGATRNYGLSIAEGEYILFVDSDDWLERECIEKVSCALEMEQADVCLAEHYIVDSGTKKYRKYNFLLNTELGALDKKKLILYSSPSVWGKLYRKNFLIKISYKQPVCVYEDMAIYPYLISQAKRICFVYEPLWNYRQNNESSIMHRWRYCKQLPEALSYCRKKLQEAGKVEEYGSILRHMALHHFALAYNQWKECVSEKELKEYFYMPFQEYLLYYHPKWERYTRYYVWGSFALSWLVRDTKPMYVELQKRCSFSSIISQFLGKKGEVSIKSSSMLRQKAVETDIRGDYFEEIVKPGVLFVDFMEERYSIIHTSNDVYITQSDAFCESDKTYDESNGEVIASGSEAFMQLWREACRCFVIYLQENTANLQVVLVRSRMAEWYGKDGKEKLFPELNSIQYYNRMFKEMEDYFLELYPTVQVIELPDELLYTNINAKYGCHCYYWNGRLYRSRDLAAQLLPDEEDG